jgi:uncharacterized protein YbjQ (UPF0145 family)
MPKQNNIKKTCFALLLACSLTVAFAQGEPEKTELEKIAVYVFGASDAGINKSFGNSLLSAITQSGKYAEIREQEAFYNELAKNHNDSISQIAQTAKQYGADFVCAVSMAEAFGEYSISARIIKTADSQIIRTGLLNRSLNSLDDLARVSDELAGQLLQSHSPVSVPPPAAVIPNEPTPQATPTAKKECKSIFNINEIVFKIQSGLLDQLKDCSATLAKNIALSKSPFGKKTELKEPKAFMMECTIDGIKQKLPSGIDEYIKPVKSFVQNTLGAASAANGELDVAKLSKAIGDMNIGELLDEIRKLAGEDECMADEPYEPPVAVGGKEEGSGSEGKGGKGRWSLGLRVGFNFSHLYAEYDNDSYHGSGTYESDGFGQIGLVFDYVLNDWLHLQPGIMWIIKGTSFNDRDNIIVADYIEIPLLISLKFSALRINAGPYFGICIDESVNGLNTHDLGEIDLSTFDFGISTGLGFAIWKFYIGAFYDYGLTESYSYSHHEIGNNINIKHSLKAYNRTLGFNLGINL